MRSIMNCSIGILLLTSLVFACFHSTPVTAQLRNMPAVSPAASVTQRIGITDITINYHRPGVKGREIWGTRLAPYNGKPFPWRAGANDNTTISFTNDVTIEGQKLAAGTYGVHMLPSEGDWIIAFNTNSTSWGSFSYKEEEDALRITVTPQKAEHNEWLNYGFDDFTDNSAVAYLKWEELKVPFKIEVDVHQIVLEHIKKELRHRPGFSWNGWYQAANYCLRNDINNEDALTWIDQSIRREENFNNLRVKSELLAKNGKAEKSKEVIDKAIEIGNLRQLDRYGRQLLGQDKVEEALNVLKINAKRNSDAWNVHRSLAQGYEKKGDTKEAVKSYKKALAIAPENQKAGIQDALNKLEGTN